MDLNCRVCFQVRDIMVHIFEEVDQYQTDLASLLKDCGGLTVQKDDTFPKYLCQQCTQELLITAEFREKCQRAAKMLLDLQNNSTKTPLLTKETVETTSTTESLQDEDVTNESLMMYEPAGGEDYLTLNDIEEQQENQATDKEQTTLTTSEVDPTYINFINNAIELVVPIEEAETLTTRNIVEENVITEEAVAAVEKEITLNSSIKNDGIDNSTKTFDDIVEELFSVENEKNDISPEQLETENPISENFSETYNYYCKACGASFVKSINHRRHMEIEHNTLLEFSCERCHRKFKVEENYRTHINICGEADPNENNEALSTISKNVKKPKKILGKHICNYCGKCLQSSFSLKMHERTHTGERPFSCDLCQSQFKTQAALTAHKKRHTGKADFVCKVCEKRFFDSSNLTTHMRTHTGVRPHSCTVCDKSFTRVFLLQLHMRTHTGEKPFQCEHCQKSFSQSCDLKYHLATHNNGERKYQCSICLKTFIRRNKLKLHMEKHATMTIAQDKSKLSEVEVSQDNADYLIDFDPELC